MCTVLKFLSLTTLAILLCTSAYAADHVLVMTISNYASKPLVGVRYDADNAIKLASALGYDTASAVVLKDGQLTGAGMRNAFKSLADRIGSGDRVFVYYSGHGTSYKTGSECTQALVAQDEALLETTELVQYLAAVKEKTSDVVVIFDACHAGGNRDISVNRARGTTRGGLDVPSLTGKVWTPKGGEQCHLPVNKVSKSWGNTRKINNSEFNFAFIAAANEREIALDDSSKGGLATLGLLACATGGVTDLDGSNSVSLDELKVCSQQYVGKTVPEVNAKAGTSYTPHTLEVWGNSAKSFPVKPLASHLAPKDKARLVLASFNSIVDNSNGNFFFNVKPTSNNVTIGKDFYFTYTTKSPTYIYMLYVGSDHKDMQQVWPPLGQHQQYIAGSGTLPVMTMQKPAGENTFLIVASQSPKDFSAVLNGIDGIIAVGSKSMQEINLTLRGNRNVSLKPNNLGNVGGYAARMSVVTGH